MFSARMVSVVPLFKEQIAAGGPITLTDDRMTRYFMSIHEAAELIVQASGFSQGGDIFVLDMGEPVRIRALARTDDPACRPDCVRTPPIPTAISRSPWLARVPGEKLYEELFYDPKAVVGHSATQDHAHHQL